MCAKWKESESLRAREKERRKRTKLCSMIDGDWWRGGWSSVEQKGKGRNFLIPVPEMRTLPSGFLVRSGGAGLTCAARGHTRHTLRRAPETEKTGMKQWIGKKCREKAPSHREDFGGRHVFAVFVSTVSDSVYWRWLGCKKKTQQIRNKNMKCGKGEERIHKWMKTRGMSEWR